MNPFNPGLWSFSFGVSSLATTALHLGNGAPGGALFWISIPLFIFTNLVIGRLMLRTFMLLIRGKLITREALPLPKTEKDLQ